VRIFRGFGIFFGSRTSKRDASILFDSMKNFFLISCMFVKSKLTLRSKPSVQLSPVARFLIIIASLAFLNCAAQNKEKPNIMIWVADDQYLESVGVYGGDPKQTPNIDKFAEQSMLFTRAYSTTSICTPARSALYTGMYPIHNGSHPNHSGLKKDVASMPSIMKELGYRTALVGKDGVHKRPTRPNNTFVWDAEYPHIMENQWKVLRGEEK